MSGYRIFRCWFVFLIVFAPAAHAMNATDILGIAPGMSLEETESKLTAGGWTKSENGVYEMREADLTYTQFQVWNRTVGAGSGDQLRVTFSTPPTQPTVIKVARTFSPGNNLVPLASAVNGSLSKYGKPSYERETNSAINMLWYQGPPGNCSHKSNNAYINQAIRVVRQQGPDAAVPCAGVAATVNIGKFNKPAGMMITKVTAELVDIAEAAKDPTRLQIYATGIVRKKQQANIKDSNTPEF